MVQVWAWLNSLGAILRKRPAKVNTRYGLRLLTSDRLHTTVLV